MTTVRRGAAALVASAVLGLTAAPAALAAPSPTPSAELPAGLYGKSDPTYDGVWRQSLALIAQNEEHLKPAQAAVDFLIGQRCANGGFPSYRADTSKDCDADLPLDTNASAAAVQALAGMGGKGAVAKKTTAWLRSVQNEDGGWGYNPGSASDANSTSVVIGALAAAGEPPADILSKGGKTPYDALLTFAKPCTGKDGGPFVYQIASPGMVADSTAAAVLALHNEGLAGGRSHEADRHGPTCVQGTSLDDAAHNGAVHLANKLAATGHLDTPPMPGADDASPKPDFGNTADAVVALSVQGLHEQAKKPLAWLEKNSAAWAKENGPAAYAQLVFAARAAGADPKNFGGTDLVSALNATGPAPEKAPQSRQEDMTNDNFFERWWFVGVIFVAAVGVGFLFSGRRKNKS
ncbi:prenyltransferase/squalene oxidase repeat-containing protein [Streptomyces sp. NPDC003023]|uniref:prenyltransferase/squalene oxidase repeat-containing protein n=1 Tax=Streptomyces sp. NPDC003023 TaxID=3364675 RepID=UPI0036C39784